MKLAIKENCKYDLLVPTSMGLRITPLNGQPVHASDSYSMTATSAETNVASISSFLGLPVKVLTTFVKESPVAQFIKNNLKSRHMDFEGPEVEQGNPWGYRHQINIADSGFGMRGPRVWNDRAGEVGRTLNSKDFDLDRIFGNEGVRIVHLSGLICALSPETSAFCLDIARAAKKHGSLISFDLNTGQVSGKIVKRSWPGFFPRLPRSQTYLSETKKTFSFASELKVLKPAVRILKPRLTVLRK